MTRAIVIPLSTPRSVVIALAASVAVVVPLPSARAIVTTVERPGEATSPLAILEDEGGPILTSDGYPLLVD